MNEDIKQCPFCAEMVPGKALKCRYCGELLVDFRPEPGQAPPRPKRMSACLILVIIGVAGLVLTGVLAALVVPAFTRVRNRAMGPRREAREAYVVGVCTDVANAQEIYSQEAGRYGTLQQLAQERMVSPELAGGVSRGYRFELEVSPDGLDWAMRAWPLRPRGSTKSYYIDTSAEVRSESYTNQSDEKAGPDSPPVWGEEDWDFDD